MNSFKLKPKPQCPDCPRQAVLNCMDKPQNKKTTDYSGNSSSNWDSDTTSSTSSSSTSRSNNGMGDSATDPLPIHPYTKFQNIQIKKVSDMVRQASINDDLLSQSPDSDLENFIQGKIGVSVTGTGGHSSMSEETTSSDFFSDYSDTDLKCLLQQEGTSTSDSNEDFENFKEALGHGTGTGTRTGRRTGMDPAQTEGNGDEGNGWSSGSGETTSRSSSMIDGDEIKACIADLELKEKSADSKYRCKDAVYSEESDGVNLSKDDSLDSESDSSSGSDIDSNSETEQERWDRITQTVKRMKLLLIKYPKFANRVGNNDIVSTLHSMMDTLESKEEGISSLDLKMVEGQMETFKKTLLSGIDEDLAKWRAQRWRSKHNLARAFSIFAVVVAVMSVVAIFVFDD